MPPIDIPQPGPRTTAVAARALGAAHRFLQPRLYGIQRIPNRGPFLLVGNHTLYGLQDVPSLVYEIERARGVFVRPLGDHLHFAIPIWRNLLCELGMVRGTRANCDALLQAEQGVMVFPGGAHEVFKGRGQHYQLMWRERVGFARLAVAHGCPIIPFAAVGADDTYTVLLDAAHPLAKPIRAISDRITGRPEAFIPIARGLGPTLVPRPERFYFHFAPPIDTTPLAGQHDNIDVLRALRNQVKRGVEDGITFLLAERESDPHRRLISRLGRAARGGKAEHVAIATGAGDDRELTLPRHRLELTPGASEPLRHPSMRLQHSNGKPHQRTGSSDILAARAAPRQHRQAAGAG
ncbi:MAG: lysophospholipid acyltransferase family protein [Solirubrobacteraceae bacterium]